MGWVGCCGAMAGAGARMGKAAVVSSMAGVAMGAGYAGPCRQ